MKSVLVCFIVFCQIALFEGANRLPSYIKPCSKTHNFGACAIESAKYAIPHLLNGDRKLGIPKITPLEIPSVTVQGNGDFSVKLIDLKVYGLENVEPIAVNVNFDKRRAHVVSKIARLYVTSNYEIHGHIMMFYLTGSGPAELTFTNGTYTYDFEWARVDKKGLEYGKIVNSSFDYQLEHVSYNFQNLIPGDRSMSIKINKVLNKNWEVVNEDLQDSIRLALRIIHDDMFDRILSQIPSNELFLD